jgi:hypothetical protein
LARVVVQGITLDGQACEAWSAAAYRVTVYLIACSRDRLGVLTAAAEGVLARLDLEGIGSALAGTIERPPCYECAVSGTLAGDLDYTPPAVRAAPLPPDPGDPGLALVPVTGSRLRPVLPDGMKLCTDGRHEGGNPLLLAEFGRNSARADGLSSRCRDCDRIRGREKRDRRAQREAARAGT